MLQTLPSYLLGISLCSTCATGTIIQGSATSECTMWLLLCLNLGLREGRANFKYFQAQTCMIGGNAASYVFSYPYFFQIEFSNLVGLAFVAIHNMDLRHFHFAPGFARKDALSRVNLKVEPPTHQNSWTHQSKEVQTTNHKSNSL